MTFIEKLATVQHDLKAPKSTNAKVPYKSRNAEEILEKAKPLLIIHGLVVTLEDSVIEVGGRLFISSMAIVSDGLESVCGTGIAELLGGNNMMNSAQASGATSSYARKYALGAVFGIGDGDDADDAKYQPQSNQSFHSGYLDDAARELTGKITEPQVSLIELKRNQLKTSDPEGSIIFTEWYKNEGFPKIRELSKQQASLIIEKLKGE